MLVSILNSINKFLLIILSVFLFAVPFSNTYCSTALPSKPNEEMQELADIEWLIKHPPPGIIFTIREYEEDAMSWVSIRLNYYIQLLRKSHPKLQIAILAHGDEVGSLSKSAEQKYEKLHQLVKSWNKQGITTHVCGTMAHMLRIDESDFPDYIDVVPFGPSQVKDYVELGHEHIELELTW